MLERYFRSLKALDRVQAQWLGPQIERYVELLDNLHTSTASIRQHVRALGHFNDFALARGATSIDELPGLVDGFVKHWQAEHSRWCKNAHDRSAVVAQSRVPVERMLCLALPSYARPEKLAVMPFAGSAPGFFPFLLNERGLRPNTLHNYTYTLRAFEAYLVRAEIPLTRVTPRCIAAFATDRAKALHKAGMVNTTSALRAFLRYVYRESIVPCDLSPCVPRGRVYRHASIPRAISWEDVERLLASIDRRSDMGKRDYAILMLLATYGLRAREIAALCLEHFDWAHDQLDIPMRKGGHSTRYPLSAAVGEATIAYLRVRRTDVGDREIFLTAKSPYIPMQHWTISAMVGVRMQRADIHVTRAGSHTLRHACVQHLVESDVPFKVIGDYVGHRDPAATLVYGKVAVHKLREMVIGHGEDVL